MLLFASEHFVEFRTLFLQRQEENARRERGSFALRFFKTCLLDAAQMHQPPKRRPGRPPGRLEQIDGFLAVVFPPSG